MMLPKPATMAAPPSTASPPSSNPAVPPPPVIGAPVGNGLGEGLGDGLATGEALGLADDDELAELDAEGLVLEEALDEAPSLTVLVAVLVAVLLAVTEPLAEGDRIVTVPEGLLLDVQAESAIQASTVARPPVAVSLTRCAVHAMAMRAFIGPPVSRQSPFPGRRPQKPPPDRNRVPITVSPGRSANREWRAHHRNIRLLG
jgi:hypothetical protein